MKRLGMNNIRMYADLFTVSREQVIKLCELMIEENIQIRWTCNSGVDYVDEEMLQMMAKAGNWLISWGIESGNDQILRQARKGAYTEKAERSLLWPVVDRARGEAIGVVTSGGPGVTVGGAIGLAYVPPAYAAPGTVLTIDCRGKDVAATVVQGKFYKRAG